EAWEDGILVGGLYGVAIGRVFFGESMFSRATDASKAAFVYAVRYLQWRSIELIDCQVGSAHLASFGSLDLPRPEFLALLGELCVPPGRAERWRKDFSTWAAALDSVCQ
ncbi:MAG TPA: leucyl/phenylalanyl-tRNA--protein transferase, partial [Gammaproteobacteria bacterium]|nr:leucyl/phenylalanyl-tRNA--protein transferase [Gammaproteobacteria bacterium]